MTGPHKRREFLPKVKVAAFQRADGHCEVCTAPLRPGKFRYDHIIPDAMGGEPTLENCRVQCLACDAPKTARDQAAIAKSNRVRAKHLGVRTSRPMPGSRASAWKRKMDGTVVPR